MVAFTYETDGIDANVPRGARNEMINLRHTWCIEDFTSLRDAKVIRSSPFCANNDNDRIQWCLSLTPIRTPEMRVQGMSLSLNLCCRDKGRILVKCEASIVNGEDEELRGGTKPSGVEVEWGWSCVIKDFIRQEFLCKARRQPAHKIVTCHLSHMLGTLVPERPSSNRELQYLTTPFVTTILESMPRDNPFGASPVMEALRWSHESTKKPDEDGDVPVKMPSPVHTGKAGVGGRFIQAPGAEPFRSRTQSCSPEADQQLSLDRADRAGAQNAFVSRKEAKERSGPEECGLYVTGEHRQRLVDKALHDEYVPEVLEWAKGVEEDCFTRLNPRTTYSLEMAERAVGIRRGISEADELPSSGDDGREPRRDPSAVLEEIRPVIGSDYVCVSGSDPSAAGPSRENATGTLLAPSTALAAIKALLAAASPRGPGEESLPAGPAVGAGGNSSDLC